MLRQEEQARLLISYAVARPDGFTYEDGMSAVGCNFRSQFYDIVRKAREVLADDEMTLVATPNGYCQPWLYSLTGTLDEANPWVNNRLSDTESRLRTMVDTVAPLTKVDGRTLAGRRARLVHRQLNRLIEDLDFLDGHTL